MLPPKSAEQTRHFRLPELHDLQLMRATFCVHAFPRHYHKTYVIEVVEHGGDEFFCENTTYTAARGQIVVIHPEAVHTGRPVGNNALNYRSLYPTVELMQEIAAWQNPDVQRPPVFSRAVIDDPPLAREIGRAHAAVESGCYSLQAQSLVTSALALLIRRHADNRQPVSQANAQSAVLRAREFIISNYTENLSLEQISKAAALSPYHLLRTFRSAVGFPPHEFLINVRIEKAKELLSTGYSLAEAALATGFYDQSHFTKHFKRLVGTPPGRFSHLV